jgi:TPR repeat protein
MGELFERGHLGFKNKTYAFQWYKVAAENGSMMALEYLREGYTGRKKDTRIRKLEMKCYTQAAILQNSKEAQFMLGTFFENGIGVDVDKEFASIWYSKSALQGYKSAIEKAKELEKEGYTFILISPGIHIFL